MNRLRVLAVCATLAAAGSSIALPAGNAAKGKEVFNQCAVCHNADSDETKMGPGLKGLFKKDKMANGKKPTEANVRSMIDEGSSKMPPFKDVLPDSDKDDLIAYLKTL